MARLKIAMPKLSNRKAEAGTAPQPEARNTVSRLSLFAATLCCAVGIGWVMQYGMPFSERTATGPVFVDQITLTSSGAAMPRMPADKASADLPGGQITLAVAEFAEMPRAMPPLPGDAEHAVLQPAVGTDRCEITMQAMPAAGAMVDLILAAPCNASERVTIHHNGLMFTEQTQPDGTLGVTVPALTETAIFIAAFANGEGASAVSQVDALQFYDRTVVQWKGDAGLQLHAREYDAAYFGEGHVWAAKAGDLSSAARGEGGFLVRLGRSDAPEALMAEVYSFPSGTAKRSGSVALSVEAEVTGQNCGALVEAQTLELRAAGPIKVHDLMLDMPDCGAEGDFLVLKNLVEDLTIASR